MVAVGGIAIAGGLVGTHHMAPESQGLCNVPLRATSSAQPSAAHTHLAAAGAKLGSLVDGGGAGTSATATAVAD